MAPLPRRPRARCGALVYLTLLALAALLLASCGATIGNGGGGSPATASHRPARWQGCPTSQPTLIVDCAVPPVILRNPTPDTLDVSMNVTFDQEPGDTQLMAAVGLSFLSAGQLVQLDGNERLTCNGIALPVHDRGATFQVIRAPAAQLAGKTIRCVYATPNATAGMLLVIPQPPAITSPRNGAAVPRSRTTIVSYRYDPTTGTLLGIVALAPGSVSPKMLARMNVPAPSQATVDTSVFNPGPGSLAFTVALTPRITGDGMPFRSLTASGTAMALVNVTWT